MFLKAVSQESPLKVVLDKHTNSECYVWQMGNALGVSKQASFVLCPHKCRFFPQPQPSPVSLPKHLQGSEYFWFTRSFHQKSPLWFVWEQFVKTDFFLRTGKAAFWSCLTGEAHEGVLPSMYSVAEIAFWMRRTVPAAVIFKTLFTNLRLCGEELQKWFQC